MAEKPLKQNFVDKLFNRITWRIIVLSALVFFVLSIIYQASSFLLDKSNELYDLRNPSSTLQAQLSYPPSACPTKLDTAGFPVGIWLWTTQSITSSSTVTSTTPVTQSILTSLPVTYSIKLDDSENALHFVNQNGLPAYPQIQISPQSTPGEPVIIYVLQSLKPWLGQSTILTVAVLDPTQPDQLLLDSGNDISINLCPWWAVSLRRLLNILFGPTATLVSVAVALIGIGVQKEIEQREKREQEAINQKIQEIKELHGLLTSNPGKVIRRWWEYRQWTRGLVESKKDWQTPELQDEIEKLWKEIKDMPEPTWQQILLKEAVGSFHKDDTNTAIERANLIKEIDPSSKSSEAIAARFLVAFIENKPRQAVNLALEFGSKTSVDAMWAFNKEYGLLAKSVVTRALAELAGHPKSITEVHRVLYGNIDGHNLLREPEFGSPLQKLIEESKSQEEKKFAEELLAVGRKEYEWPPLWPTRSLVHYGIDTKLDWLKEVVSESFEYNPFNVQKAELEPNLLDYRIDPKVLHLQGGPLREKRPMILFGKKGGGKTAIALLLTEGCYYSEFSEEQAFPVYYPLEITSPVDSKSIDYLEVIVRALGRAITEFLTLNPHSFLDLNENRKFAITHLLTLYVGSSKNLNILFRQSDLSNNNMGRRLLAEITEKSRDIPNKTIFNDIIQLQMLQYARLFNFKYNYILLDISSKMNSQIPAGKVVEQIQYLLELIQPLARVDVYLTLFLPLDLQKKLIIPDGVAFDILSWTREELMNLIKTRLEVASQGQIVSLTELFDPDARDLDPTNLLIKASKNSPGKLIRLVHQLLEYQVQKGPFEKIDSATLEAVVSSANREKGKDSD